MFLFGEADNNWVSNFFAAISIIVAVVFGVINFIIERERNRLKDELDAERKKREGLLEKLREYARKHPKAQTEFVEGILLGPRDSGKTSLVKLWTAPWTDIKTLAGDPIWNDYIIQLHQFEHQTYHDELFDLHDRVLLRSLRLRIRDYPGEDHYLFEAIKSLKNLNKKIVLIFIMNVNWRNNALCDVAAGENDRYFSKMFVEAIHEHITSVSSVVSRVMIVFNKADLLPPEWDDDQALRELRRASPGAIRHIESLFNPKVDFHITSSMTNKGIVNLLGDIGRNAIDFAQEREKKRFDNSLGRLKELAAIKGIT